MSTPETPSIQNTGINYVVSPQDWHDRPASYRCSVAVIKEEDGDYSAITLNLPGTGGSGDTEEEAIAELIESVRAAIESYRMSAAEIPWTDPEAGDVPDNAKRHTVIVNV